MHLGCTHQDLQSCQGKCIRNFVNGVQDTQFSKNKKQYIWSFPASRGSQTGQRSCIPSDALQTLSAMYATADLRCNKTCTCLRQHFSTYGCLRHSSSMRRCLGQSSKTHECLKYAGKAKSASPACSLRAGTCIVSQALEQQLQEQVLSEARRAAEVAQQQRVSSNKAASTSTFQPASDQTKAGDSKPGGLLVMMVGQYKSCAR